MSEWRVIKDLGTIPPVKWQQLATANNPFLSHAFLYGLEKFACLKNQNWTPAHIIIENNNDLLGCLPLYIKVDSYGEFVFDWAWADAYHQAGRNYYPKLVSAIPFTPVAGARLLVNNDHNPEKIKQHLLDAALELMDANDFSSIHMLFPEETSMSVASNNAAMKRLTCQFHWLNADYRDFQDFTDSLTSKKRKKILKERRDVNNTGVQIERLNGHEITEAQWTAFYQFYSHTFYSKWGEPRLTLDFFKWIGRELAEQVLLIMAKKNNEYIAGAFAMSDDNTLYGRHWGCIEQVPYLHFELCYYQTIEHTINKRLKRLDAGVQGEHKLARGFHPIAMPSAHWVREQDFRNAIASYLKRETNMMQQHIAMLETHLPFKAS